MQRTDTDFTLDPRLENDSHFLFTWQNCQVRLNKNATIPWFLLIPETTETEFCELSVDTQIGITALSKWIGRYLKQHFSTEKINFAAIGNVVSQLHIHVIGRHAKDPLWPDVVWGQVYSKTAYSKPMLNKIIQDLQEIVSKQST